MINDLMNSKLISKVAKHTLYLQCGLAVVGTVYAIYIQMVQVVTHISSMTDLH